MYFLATYRITDFSDAVGLGGGTRQLQENEISWKSGISRNWLKRWLPSVFRGWIYRANSWIKRKIVLSPDMPAGR
jgi:hypothetical protein